MEHISPVHRSVRRLLLPVLLLLGLVRSGYGFVEIYQGALTLDLEGRIIYDSNLGGNATTVSDTLFSLRPTLRYQRDVGRSNTSAWFGLNFSRYQDYTVADFNDFDLGFSIDAPTAQGSNLTGKLDFRYYQDTGSNTSLLRYVQTQRFNFNLNASYLIGARTSLRFGAGYRVERPEDVLNDPPVNYSQSTYYDVTLGIGYQWRSIYTLFLDYRRSWNKSEDDNGINTGRDYASNAVFVGLSRPLGGKVDGSFSIGYQTSQDRRNTDLATDRFLVSANVNWAPREKTTLGLRIGRDLNISGYNTGYYDTNVAVTVRQDLGQRWALNGRLGYSWYDYESDRSDDVLNFRAGLAYSYNSRLTGGIDYDYQDSNSNRELGTYTRNRVTLRVSYEF
ncbi:MAG: outer membrane beta-barrel protein [Opitutaceae bacterium]